MKTDELQLNEKKLNIHVQNVLVIIRKKRKSTNE